MAKKATRKKPRKITWETLDCQEGKHTWKRQRVGGRKPANCPEHQPVEDPAIALERAERLAEGKRKAALARAHVAAEQVTAMSNWIKADARYYRIKREIEEGLRDPHELPSRPISPKIPEDAQYRLAREHGLI